MTETVKSTKKEQIHTMLFDMEEDIRSSRSLANAALLIADYGQLNALDDNQCGGLYEVIRNAIEAIKRFEDRWEAVSDLMGASEDVTN